MQTKDEVRFRLVLPMEIECADAGAAKKKALDWRLRGYRAYAVGYPAMSADNLVEHVVWYCRVESELC